MGKESQLLEAAQQGNLGKVEVWFVDSVSVFVCTCGTYGGGRGRSVPSDVTAPLPKGHSPSPGV